MNRVESLWFDDQLKSVLMFSFELFKVASGGGLGTAVYGLSTALARAGVKTTVIMPSHGRHLSDPHRSSLGLREIDVKVYGVRRGENGAHYRYAIGAEAGRLDGVEVILVKGLDYETGRILDSWGVYDWSLEKSALFARVAPALVQYLLNRREIPSLIHIHDWHSVLAGTASKYELEVRRVIVPTVFTVHLLNKVGVPWHYASEEWAGLQNCPHYIWSVSKHVLKRTKEVWDELSAGFIERFGAYEADLLTSVSSNYLREVIEFVGYWAENKSCVTYDGTDWNLEEVERLAEGVGIRDRAQLRTRLLSSLPSMKVVPEDFSTGSILWQHKGALGIRDDWTYEPLAPGQLVLFTGRVVYQKGLDLLLKSFKRVVNRVPDARLVVLGIPGKEYDLLREVVNDASALPNNVRLLLSSSIDRATYKLFHYAASVFVSSSRWEPFGINVIEAMAVGTPVVGYRVGGVAETVVDLRYNADGTGLLARPESVEELADYLSSALLLSKAAEESNMETLRTQSVVSTDDVRLWLKIRQNAINRVRQNFTWDAARDRVLECYKKGAEMARYRTMASF
ncbi:glycogen synthase [Sulfodiicoccus acidiphilus]|nr:glycosyltransferase [Sulfodiicoccus acidiphilus]GGU02384.1 glycogen synthase [Sulfodiicoccus acidiphilus]